MYTMYVLQLLTGEYTVIPIPNQGDIFVGSFSAPQRK